MFKGGGKNVKKRFCVYVFVGGKALDGSRTECTSRQSTTPLTNSSYSAADVEPGIALGPKGKWKMIEATFRMVAWLRE